MNKTISILITICLLAAFEGCAQSGKHDSKTEYHKISAAEAKKIMDENPKALLLDVRTEAEYKEVHIPGAILLPVSDIEAKAAIMLPDKNALILVYCRSGRRATSASLLLVAKGYTNVYDFGGIIDWPYQTEKGE